jgi:hypothetical protein
MWRCVDLASTVVLEERIASIFRVEKSASCSYWVNASSVAPNFSPLQADTLPLIHIPLLPAVDLHHRPLTPLRCCIPMWHTLPLSLFLYSWLFWTGDSVCSHLLMLVHRSRIFLPWRWRRYVPPKRRLTQDLHSATSQKTTFFNTKHVSGVNYFFDSVEYTTCHGNIYSALSCIAVHS